MPEHNKNFKDDWEWFRQLLHLTIVKKVDHAKKNTYGEIFLHTVVLLPYKSCPPKE